MPTVWTLALALFISSSLGQEKGDPIKFQNVVVRPGDTLWGIAQKYLKDPKSWADILRYNTLPSSDPTVALPGMTLKVPIVLIKESLRAAILEYMTNQVFYRKKESAEWKGTTLQMQLMRDDGLRTLASSRARVRFVNGDILSLDQNSMAIIKPLNKDYDLELLRGEIHTLRSSVVTATARITPKTKDTKYSAKVSEDLSTRVEVYTGQAEVEGEGKKVEIKAGFATDVAVGQPPTLPTKIPKLPDFEARLGEGGVVTVRTDVGAEARPLDGQSAGAQAFATIAKALSVGVPVAAYHVQASKSPDFDKVVFDKTYDVDDQVDFQASKLPPGRYYWRIAVVDLLGVEGRYSKPEVYNVTAKAAPPRIRSFTAKFDVTRPSQEEETVTVPKYRLMGRAEPGLKVTVNNQRVALDEDGSFSHEILLKEGANRYRVTAIDQRGNEREYLRTIVYNP